MRVAIIGPADSFKSGISAYSDRLADAFARAGHATWYLPIRKLLPRFLFPGKERAAEPAQPKRYRMGPPLDYDDPLSILAGARFVERLAPDLLLVPWWTGAAAHMTLPLAAAAKRSRAQVIVDLHETRDPREERHAATRAYGRWALRRMARHADVALAHASSEMPRLRAEAPPLGPKLQVMPHPAFDHYGEPMPKWMARSALGLSTDARIVLLFGLVRQYKGVPDAVRALEHLRPEVRDRLLLLIVGETWGGKGELEAALAESPHRDRTVLVDRYVPDDEVALYFSAADVVALPYRRAAQSGVLGVAKRFGNRVVVSRVGGLPEAVHDYPWKAVCRPDDPPDLARAIEEVLRAPKRPHRYRAFTWDDAVAQLERLVPARPVAEA